jgi:TetR/AcrR family transcriptional repressor of nem operon
MRYDAEHKSTIHQKIVKGASRQLRKKGLNGPTVAALMKASGLTHGGFYKHFSSRDDLVVEAVEESLRELTHTLLEAAEHSGPKDAWKAIVTTYLSRERCDRFDIGCPIAALAPDIARSAPGIKQRSSAAILKFRAELLPYMPGRSDEERQKNFLAILTSIVGAIVIARTMPDAQVREAILNSTRERLLTSF